jgi:hypothetical protein
MSRSGLIFFTLGVLLAAPPPSSPEPAFRAGEFSWFSLDETMSDVRRVMGPPVSVSDFGEDLRSWQYRIGGTDGHDFSHYFVFRKSTGKLVSVTRCYDPEQPVDAIFPSSDTKVVLSSNSAELPYGARVRRLSGGRFLIAMGSLKEGQPTGQLTLIAGNELNHFFPWIGRATVTRLR